MFLCVVAQRERHRTLLSFNKTKHDLHGAVALCYEKRLEFALAVKIEIWSDYNVRDPSLNSCDLVREQLITRLIYRSKQLFLNRFRKVILRAYSIAVLSRDLKVILLCFGLVYGLDLHEDYGCVLAGFQVRSEGVLLFFDEFNVL